MPTTTDPSVTLRRGGLTFRPATLDRFALDRAVAWLESAWRNAAT